MDEKGLVELLRDYARASVAPQCNRVMRRAADAITTSSARLAAAEAELAKMREALGQCACDCADLSDCPDGLSCAGWIAKDALASNMQNLHNTPAPAKEGENE